MRLKTVVLPAPFGPMSPTNSRSPTVLVSSDTAVNPPKRMVQPSSSSSGVAMCQADLRFHSGQMNKPCGRTIINEMISSE